MSEQPNAAAPAPASVAIQDVDRALNAALRAMHGPNQTLVFRARLSNLVVFCDTEDGARRVLEAIPGVMALHPARVLLLVGAAGPDSAGVSATVQMRPHVVPHGRVLCSEQVTLRASGRAVERLAFAVRELLIGDLPTNLWWATPQPPGLAGGFLHDLAEHAQQLVYDSLGWAEPARGVAATAAWLRQFERPPVGGDWRAAADLNWRRLKYWRRLLSQALDPASAPGAIASIAEVLVEHGPHAVIEAWELVSWLASRLGWRVQEGREQKGVEFAWQVEAPHGPVRLVIRRLADGPSEITHLRIACTLSNQPAALDFAAEDHQRLAVRPEGAPGTSRTVTVQKQGLVELIARQLSDREFDPVFSESMTVAQSLARNVPAH
jgi:glucose-6-phosphate dehydrogenase assembly protein OpcA